MKVALAKYIQAGLLLVLALSQTACGNNIFSNSGGSSATTNAAVNPNATPYNFITDSFERDNIYEDTTTGTIYGWRGMVLDGLNAVIGFVGLEAQAIIPPAGQNGIAADGSRYLLMQIDDNGTDTEKVYVISQPYDLSAYTSASISFDYITFDLNDPTSTVPQSLVLQVCNANLNDCGVNLDNLFPTAVEDDSVWTTVFTNDATIDDRDLNGHNQTLSDWHAETVTIDLTDTTLVQFPGSFVFRFVTTMQNENGSSGGTKCCNNGGNTYAQNKSADNGPVKSRCHTNPPPPPPPPCGKGSSSVFRGAGVDDVIGIATSSAPPAE